ncbi:HTTM domain-containing protein [Nocardioides sp. zg-1230]|uniref:HTTM domain-containing protein n=1 Tax=Nocardioides sp. zg-1230 TaxID=2736601 RepID=UPI0015548168|nr:HTTM domain-containing protein [Nocardioides sp. zg-1230]NPC43525.1 HTTM domain-containing protein [Nocardioides sp. zg-1230]
MNTVEIHAILGRVRDGALAMPGPVQLALTQTAVSAWTLTAMTSAILVLVGLLTTPAALAGSATCLTAMLWDQQAYTNHFWLTTLLLAYLAFAGSDNVWSVSSLFGQRTRATSLPVLLMVTQLSVCYLFGALAKINPWWLAGDELRAQLLTPLPEVVGGHLPRSSS